MFTRSTDRILRSLPRLSDDRPGDSGLHVYRDRIHKADHLDSIQKFGQGMSAADCKQRVIIYCLQSQFQRDRDSISPADLIKYVKIIGRNTVRSGGYGNSTISSVSAASSRYCRKSFQGKVGISCNSENTRYICKRGTF